MYENDCALIRVIDSGVGIATEQLGRVFDMFARVKPAEPAAINAYGGLGVGLALSRRLAEMHGGSISVTSDGAGKGSVFTLTLPAERRVLPVAEDSAVSSGPPQLGANVPIVIIEDNEDSAEVLALALEGRGFVPSVAHTGPAGLELVRQKRPPIVLCDIGLPEMDGIEVCRRIRELEQEYRPVLIALTGWGMKDDVRRTQESGFDHHLVKPVAPQKLFELLDRVAAPRA
jgi:CheY-like chemotaxis protein